MNMATIRAADGGYLLNAEHFNYTKNELGQPVLNVVGGGGGQSVQTDYTENDVTAASYLKNRPGGYAYDYPAKTITFDGNLDGKYVISIGETSIVKVSDDILTEQQLIGASITFGEQTITLSDNSVATVGDVVVAEAIYVALKAGATFYDVIFEQAGTYFMYYLSKDGNPIYISKLDMPEESGIVKFPIEFMPGKMIYSVSDLDSLVANTLNSSTGLSNAVVFINDRQDVQSISDGEDTFDGIYLPVPQSMDNENCVITIWNLLDGNVTACFKESNTISQKFTIPTNSYICLQMHYYSGRYYTTNGPVIPLPTVTAENNGQFLRVVDGEWKNGDLIVNSSTPDSTKKFRITVDDAGTITATEVTT